MLHPLYTQNLWDFLKFIVTIKVLFHLLPNLLPLYPTIKFISSCSFKSFSFLYVLYVKVSVDEHQYLLRSLSVTSYTLNECFPFSLALRIRRICSFRSSNCVVNELTQAEYRNRRGYNLGLLKQEIQRVPYHTRSHKRLTHTFPSSCRLPPSHSLNILYFPPTHLHSPILPTLCYYPEIYTSLDQSS